MPGPAKRKIVVFGNCMGGALAQVLRQTPAVAATYEVIDYPENLWGETLAPTLPDYGQAEIVLAQEVQSWGSHRIADHLGPSTRLIRYPLVMHQACWPFDALMDRKDPAFVEGAPFFYGDWAMGRLRALGMTPTERVRAYLALDWPGAPDANMSLRRARLERQRLLDADQRLDSRLGRFILDHHSRAQLFHTIGHPTGLLVREVALEMIEKMGFSADGLEAVDCDFFSNHQVPVHPRVAEALELDWAPPGRTYRFVGDEFLTFEQYYARYAEAYG